MDDYSSSTSLSFLNNSQLFTESTNILEKAGLVLEKAGLTLTPSDDPVKSVEETFLLNDTVLKNQAEEKTFISSSNSASTSIVSSKQQTPLVSAKEASSRSICQSASGSCIYAVVKGFKYCQYHLFEDTRNSYEKCSYISPTTSKQCTHPVISSDGTSKTFCSMHIVKDASVKSKKLKKKKPTASKVSEPSSNNIKKRPSSLAVSQGMNSLRNGRQSSSEEEEFNFYTDTVQVKKTECMWLGNQASDADSTDSEDENPLNHAGIWTLEEVLKICKEKMVRLRSLYAQQFKRMNYHLKEERRRYVTEFDMDPFMLSKVPFYRKTDDIYKDYMEDVYLTNYQRCTGEEVLAEKLMREKRSKGPTLHTRRTDLPKCQLNVDGARCTNKVLPFSKFCVSHILNDNAQYLYARCAAQNKKCSEPGDMLNGTCREHLNLISRPTEKYWKNFVAAKKQRENRKRKADEEKEKVPPKPTRSSARLRIDQRRKTAENSPIQDVIEQADIKTETNFKSPSALKSVNESSASLTLYQTSNSAEFSSAKLGIQNIETNENQLLEDLNVDQDSNTVLNSENTTSPEKLDKKTVQDIKLNDSKIDSTNFVTAIQNQESDKILNLETDLITNESSLYKLSEKTENIPENVTISFSNNEVNMEMKTEDISDISVTSTSVIHVNETEQDNCLSSSLNKDSAGFAQTITECLKDDGIDIASTNEDNSDIVVDDVVEDLKGDSRSIKLSVKIDRGIEASDTAEEVQPENLFPLITSSEIVNRDIFMEDNNKDTNINPIIKNVTVEFMSTESSNEYLNKTIKDTDLAVDVKDDNPSSLTKDREEETVKEKDVENDDFQTEDKEEKTIKEKDGEAASGSFNVI